MWTLGRISSAVAASPFFDNRILFSFQEFIPVQREDESPQEKQSSRQIIKYQIAVQLVPRFKALLTTHKWNVGTLYHSLQVIQWLFWNISFRKWGKRETFDRVTKGQLPRQCSVCTGKSCSTRADQPLCWNSTETGIRGVGKMSRETANYSTTVNSGNGNQLFSLHMGVSKAKENGQQKLSALCWTTAGIALYCLKSPEAKCDF